MKYLLDTCVISELVNQRPNARVVEWLVTRNVDDMAGMGVPIFNPFDE